MIDFPASPTVNQQFTAAGVTWTWDGTKWLPAGLSPTVVGGINDNRIINGDMRIDQRNNGAQGTAGGYTVDRWAYAFTQPSKGTWQRYSGAGVLASFPYCLAFGSTSAYTPAAGDSFQFAQAIEADAVSDFAWGTASAQAVTLSFWANSSLSGTFGGSLANSTNTRSYPFSYTLVANAWTKIVITIPGDTGGTWVMSGNAKAMIVYFDLGTGATYRGPANAWASANYVGVTGAVSVVSTNGAAFNLTGVKLETGSVATPFNRQSLAKSMADCQRYYQVLGQFTANAYNAAGSNSYATYTLPVAMRATPTAAYSSIAYGNANTLNSQGLSTSIFAVTFVVTATGSAYAQFVAALSAEL